MSLGFINVRANPWCVLGATGADVVRDHELHFRSKMKHKIMSYFECIRDSSDCRPLSPDCQNRSHEYFKLLVSKDQWPVNPTLESDWSGRGQHAEFQKEEQSLVTHFLSSTPSLPLPPTLQSKVSSVGGSSLRERLSDVIVLLIERQLLEK